MASNVGKIVRGSKITLASGSYTAWRERTDEDLARLREADRMAGRYCDDAGEPILYGRYSIVDLPDSGIEATVVSMRPRSWMGTSRRPKGLLQVIDSSDRMLLVAPNHRN